MTRSRAQTGSGLLSTLFGVSATLVMLGLAVNVALGLWSRSTVDAIAYDTARYVATADPDLDDSTVKAEALERANRLLGSRAAEVSMKFTSRPGDDQVELRVESPGVALMPRMISAAPMVGGLDRRIVMYRERS